MKRLPVVGGIDAMQGIVWIVPYVLDVTEQVSFGVLRNRLSEVGCDSLIRRLRAWGTADLAGFRHRNAASPPD